MMRPVSAQSAEPSLTSEDIAEFKRMLTHQLNDLLYSAERTVGFLLQHNTQSADPIERAVIDVDRNYTLRIRERESRLINKIKITLDKIEDGTFGICEACEEEINPLRLKARPVAAYCIRCKTIIEAHEETSGF